MLFQSRNTKWVSLFIKKTQLTASCEWNKGLSIALSPTVSYVSPIRPLNMRRGSKGVLLWFEPMSDSSGSMALDMSFLSHQQQTNVHDCTTSQMLECFHKRIKY